MSTCAACGLPGHRYGRNEGMERYDPMACINQLRGELERREITVDYEAGLDAFLTFGFVRPFPHDGFDRRQAIGEIVKPIIVAALGRGDTREE